MDDPDYEQALRDYCCEKGISPEVKIYDMENNEYLAEVRCDGELIAKSIESDRYSALQDACCKALKKLARPTSATVSRQTNHTKCNSSDSNYSSNPQIHEPLDTSPQLNGPFKQLLGQALVQLGQQPPQVEFKMEGKSHEPNFTAIMSFEDGRVYFSAPSKKKATAEQDVYRKAYLDLIGRLDPHQSALIFGEDLSRCKSLLQEFVMHSMGGTPKYKAEPRGEAHNLQWTAEVTLPDGNVFNTRPTCYKNKKMAECAAARLALSWLLGITTSSPPPEFVQEEESAESQKNLAKQLLLKHCQEALLPNPTYHSESTGPSHQPKWTTTIQVGNYVIRTKRYYSSKKESEQAAAFEALQMLKEQVPVQSKPSRQERRDDGNEFLFSLLGPPPPPPARPPVGILPTKAPMNTTTQPPKSSATATPAGSAASAPTRTVRYYVEDTPKPLVQPSVGKYVSSSGLPLYPNDFTVQSSLSSPIHSNSASTEIEALSETRSISIDNLREKILRDIPENELAKEILESTLDRFALTKHKETVDSFEDWKNLLLEMLAVVVEGMESE